MRFSSDCCWETLTLIFGEVRDPSFRRDEGALTMWMLCSSSFVASFCTLALFPFILSIFSCRYLSRDVVKKLTQKKETNLWCTFKEKWQDKGRKPPSMVPGLPFTSDFDNLLDGLQSVLSEIPIVSLWPISFPLKLKSWILPSRIGKRKKSISP